MIPKPPETNEKKPTLFGKIVWSAYVAILFLITFSTIWAQLAGHINIRRWDPCSLIDYPSFCQHDAGRGFGFAIIAIALILYIPAYQLVKYHKNRDRK